MAQVTFPPHFAMGAGRHHLGRQGAVQRRMPLGGDLWLQRGQIVKPRQNLSSCTVWAAAAAHGAGTYRGLVVVSLLTTPPHLTVRTGRDLLGVSVSFCWDAIGLQWPGTGWPDHFHRQSPFPGADGATTAAAGPGRYGSLPLMSLFTEPPHLTGSARWNLLRGKVPVFVGCHWTAS